MQSLHRTLALLCLVALPSCKITVDLPQQFLVTERSKAEFKATTAADAIFWIEKYELPERGENLEFWADALKNDFVENRGYTLIDSDDVKTSAGLAGVQMTFEATIQGQAYSYLVAIFVEPARLFSNPIACVARFTAEKSEFARHADAVKAAILTTRE